VREYTCRDTAGEVLGEVEEAEEDMATARKLPEDAAARGVAEWGGDSALWRAPVFGSKAETEPSL
jgi:hypothetical protein